MEADGNNNIVRFTYTGEEEIPDEATHIFITARVVPAEAFRRHPNIVQVRCGEGVEKIEQNAFHGCPRLRRVIMPGVRELERDAFRDCTALSCIECGKLEIIGDSAFLVCESLSIIDLPSIKIIEEFAFGGCKNLMNVKFGKELESIRENVFFLCPSLERITLPLKDGMIAFDDVFQGCIKLNLVDLVEGAVLNDTVAALLMEEWKNDMSNEIENISKILPNTPAGDLSDAGLKTRAIRSWITSVLDKIVHYKSEHRRYVNEAAATLQSSLPNDIVIKNILPFLVLELPPYTFEGEVLLEDEDEPPPAATHEHALPQNQDSVVNLEVEEEQVNHHFFDLSSVALSLVIVIVSILMGAIIYETISIWLEAKALTDADEL